MNDQSDDYTDSQQIPNPTINGHQKDHTNTQQYQEQEEEEDKNQIQEEETEQIETNTHQDQQYNIEEQVDSNQMQQIPTQSHKNDNRSPAEISEFDVNAKNFWGERKEAHIKLKQWEDERNYFQLYIKIQTEHSQVLVRNVTKHLDPLKKVYEEQGSKYHFFIQSLKELDVQQANTIVEMSKNLKLLIEEKIVKLTKNMKKACEKYSQNYTKKQKEYLESQVLADKLYEQYSTHFDQNEQNFRKGVKITAQDRDLWFVEKQYMRQAQHALSLLTEFKTILFTAWDEGREMEVERIKTIKSMYDDIIIANKKIFGENEVQNNTITQLNQISQLEVAQELFSFRALISEAELKSMIQLNEICNTNIDFINATDDQIKEFINSVEFEKAPESNLIVKKGIVKRDAGVLNSNKDSTAVFTRDNYIYIFDWSVVKAQDFSDPKLFINLNNCVHYEIKKDMKVEITEHKKGLFSSQKKIQFKTLTVDDLEDWINLIKKHVNEKKQKK
eukprot:403369992